MQRPRFNDARTPHLAARLVPPFSFRDVTMRVFPLVADTARLQQFVDRHLNLIAPEPVGRFEVALPFVYLQLVRYGKMSVDAGGGWISQHEVNFTIPLAWYARHAGSLVFKDWAYFTPYMLVDSPLSMTTGREVGGWPKTLGAVIDDYAARRTTVTLDPEERDRRDVLLQIDADGAETGVRGVIGRASTWAARSVDILRASGHLRDRATLPDALRMFERLSRFVVDLHTASPYWLALNLKQFRSATRPELVDYQAFVATKLQLEHIRRVGLAGSGALLLGDVNCGARVELHERGEFPLVDALGLAVAATRRDAGGQRIDQLAAVFPFQLEFDMHYPHGEVLAWRTGHSNGWRTSDGSPAAPTSDDDAPRFVAYPGENFEASAPGRSTDANLCVLPLLADRTKLQAFCDAYLNEPLATSPYRVEAWGAYAYLLVTSETARCVELVVPVRWYQRDVLHGVALVPVYSCCDRAAAAIARSEIDGIPTLPAAIAGPLGRESLADGDGPLLTVRTEVLASPGRRAEVAPLLEIVRNSQAEAASTPALLLSDTFPARRLHEQRRIAESVPDRRIDLCAPLRTLTLKQFRDAAAPSTACHQSVILGERAPERVSALAELEHIEVRLHEFPGQPLVKTLGLRWRAVDVGGPVEVYVFEPCRPFHVQTTLRRGIGHELVVRAGSDAWWVPPLLPADDEAVHAKDLEPQVLLESLLRAHRTSP
ncbi:acetoacetate decarboxylase family protein [Nannocystis radixulma]|uniref:Acetoacetate decarboxylase family protein n=1 Tax=Nannocystis radixulma TaxID=2995305 RepID=A0ABT5B1C2_9BACT|nr:acetoacetate decarboxylase family protein [Nannocystis radixulma]MDC0667906.1 acetoacetate decarboxylase family protein [Nannocystis radixulma]